MSKESGYFVNYMTEIMPPTIVSELYHDVDIATSRCFNLKEKYVDVWMEDRLNVECLPGKIKVEITQQLISASDKKKSFLGWMQHIKL